MHPGGQKHLEWINNNTNANFNINVHKNKKIFDHNVQRSRPKTQVTILILYFCVVVMLLKEENLHEYQVEEGATGKGARMLNSTIEMRTNWLRLCV